ncbi:50S ribosomal protein 6, chloroplastic [Apostasia shenzhenica]|uniref:50S ribosomal protein 6, chloroplastic n=1 Tax=Apostasia shenzhenica TaxID=1088818 RepID=A0A2I0A4D8_9ASPA|nr:50S ribosomal protein 6, chloroplastic [Apostasia shenzhenica]
MTTSLSGVFAGVLPASLGGGKQRAAMRCFSGGGGGGSMAAECSSRPQKKGTVHHMKTRPKKTQPWDVKRKGPTFYPKLPPLPPDWTLVSSGDGEGDNGTIVSQQQQKEEEGLLPAITATDAF